VELGYTALTEQDGKKPYALTEAQIRAVAATLDAAAMAVEQY
jgi:hypothetical protein